MYTVQYLVIFIILLVPKLETYCAASCNFFDVYQVYYTYLFFKSEIKMPQEANQIKICSFCNIRGNWMYDIYGGGLPRGRLQQSQGLSAWASSYSSFESLICFICIWSDTTL